jgi:hypothetical protein
MRIRDLFKTRKALRPQPIKTDWTTGWTTRSMPITCTSISAVTAAPVRPGCASDQSRLRMRTTGISRPSPKANIAVCSSA